MTYSKRRAFTLIEVMITLLIIVMIATFGIGKYSNIQEDAKIKIDIAAARQIGDAAELVLIENSSLNSSDLTLEVKKRLKYPEPTSKRYGETFILVVTSGEVKVSGGSLEIYPTIQK